MSVFTIQMSTIATLTVSIAAATRTGAEHAALDGFALPRWPVLVAAAEDCPPGAEASIATSPGRIEPADDITGDGEVSR